MFVMEKKVMGQQVMDQCESRANCRDGAGAQRTNVGAARQFLNHILSFAIEKSMIVRNVVVFPNVNGPPMR